MAVKSTPVEQKSDQEVVQDLIAQMQTLAAQTAAARGKLAEYVADTVLWYYDPKTRVYVGPDRHNAQTVVLYDERQARAAAAQMQFDGERSCDMRNCKCKFSGRSNPFN